MTVSSTLRRGVLDSFTSGDSKIVASGLGNLGCVGLRDALRLVVVLGGAVVGVAGEGEGEAVGGATGTAGVAGALATAFLCDSAAASADAASQMAEA